MVGTVLPFQRQTRLERLQRQAELAAAERAVDKNIESEARAAVLEIQVGELAKRQAQCDESVHAADTEYVAYRAAGPGAVIAAVPEALQQVKVFDSAAADALPRSMDAPADAWPCQLRDLTVDDSARNRFRLYVDEAPPQPGSDVLGDLRLRVCGELVWNRAHPDWDLAVLSCKRTRGGWYDSCAFASGCVFTSTDGRAHAWAVRVRLPHRRVHNYCIGVARQGHSVNSALHASPNAWVLCDADCNILDEDTLAFVLRYAEPDRGTLEVYRRGKQIAQLEGVGEPVCTGVSCLSTAGYGAEFVQWPKDCTAPNGAIVY
eukprot:TRINITY_DN50408_c0_g1_i1.p1 TRINITY_DN50408_c0_g1~~TRINITY_DN50408_c0_g1_i1.p1  ORF type:complete len:318 (+),score=60.11 TRINITY_DN50408_c0_g1_i1:70-1023(+)